MDTFRDEFGGTGQMVNGVFVAYSSQEEADAIKINDKTAKNKETDKQDEKKK